MNDNASQRPWRAEPSGRVGTDCLFDADGTYICTVPKIDSALIVDAVNERETLFTDMKITHAELQLKTKECEKLREIAKHICTLLEDAYDPTDPGANPNGWAVFGEELRLSLIKEIRAAIEEAIK